MSRKVSLLVLTLAFVLFLAPLAWYNDEDLKSDYLTWKWHPNKISIQFLFLSFGSIKPLFSVDRACCEIVLLSMSFDFFQ